jgi:hypothetical protein
MSNTSRNTIPVDVLRAILDHVDKAGLVTICQLNKICCSCSQDFLYRNINILRATQSPICQTLAQSAHLARRVHSFETYYDDPALPKALQNMSSLRHLRLMLHHRNADILEGCIFKLESFATFIPHTRSFFQFLDGQPNLTDVECCTGHWPTPESIAANSQSIEASSLPILNRIVAGFSEIQQFITGRPISEVTSFVDSYGGFVDFTLSTAPIKRLRIDYPYLRQEPFHLLGSTFSSLTNLTIDAKLHFKHIEIVCDLDFI